MDKARCKQILHEVGIPVAPGIVVSCAAWRDDPVAIIRNASELGYPYFVKPSRGGSSIGAGRVDSREEAADALAAAFACDSDVLIEEAMPSPREIECGVLGSTGGQHRRSFRRLARFARSDRSTTTSPSTKTRQPN